MRRSPKLGEAIRAASLLILAMLVLVPSVAEACPVCFSGTGENRAAYFATFLFLTFTPLIGAGLLIWWLRNRIHELDELDAAAAKQPAQPDWTAAE